MQRIKDKLSGEKLRRLIRIDNPLVLEIGCNDGEDSQVFLDLFPRVELHCFEPEPRAIADFKSRVSDPRCTLHEVAVASQVGESTFYQSGGTTEGARQTDWNMSGSLNKPTGHLEYSPWCTFDKTISVPTITLDSFLAGMPGRRVDLLWMDVQGGEAGVIDGGRAALRSVRFIYLEYGHWHKPLYDGQLDLQQTIRKLGSAWRPLATYENYNLLCRNLAIPNGK